MVDAVDSRPVTVQVSRTTWRRLGLLRFDPGDTFDDVVKRLLDEREARAGEAK
jgi:hypothetical protein